jgi:hypothetical protein
MPALWKNVLLALAGSPFSLILFLLIKHQSHYSMRNGIKETWQND